jgi:ligand-binding sensor domain-containing protein
MHLRGLLYFLLSVFMTAFSGKAQQVRMTAYTVNEGLLSNSIQRIFQDSRGNIWISTIEGLSKYDGYRFTNYTKAHGLPHTLVNDMLETSGTLVFACNDGQLAWMRDDRIFKVTNPGVIINQFFKTKSGKILVATDASGIQQFENGQLHKPPQPFPRSYYFSLAEINDSLLLAGSDSSVQILTQDLKLVKRFGNPSTYYGPNQVLKDRQGRLWATHLPGLVQLSRDTIAYPAVSSIPEVKGANIQHIIEDKEGNVWIASLFGLVRLGREGTIRIIKKKNGLLSDIAICIFQDREDNLWVGTSLGLCKMSVTSAVTAYDEADGLAYPFISSMFAEKEDKLVTVTIKGWQFFDIKEGKFSPLIDARSLPYAIHHQLAYHPALNSDAGAPLLRSTKTGRDLENFFRQQNHLGHITRMCYAGNCVFISVAWRFYVYDGKRVFEDTSLGFNDARLDNQTITGMVVDNAGALWISTWEHGLLKVDYDIENGHFRCKTKTVLLPSTAIRTLMVDKKGNIWAGSRYNGVYRLKPSPAGSYEIKNWNSNNGLASNWVHTLFEDEKGNIWLVFPDGMDKLINKGDSFRVFNFSRVNNFYGNIYHVLSGGNASLWLGTSNGLVHMQDKQMEEKAPWHVNITAINVGDSSYFPESMPRTFSYKRNNVRIDFSAPTYINEKQVMYSYRLLGGADTSWSNPENLHSVSLANLKPAAYRFEVRTMGWNGQWGDPTSVQFTILAPLWQRAWFLALFFLLLAAFITLLVRTRIRYIKNEVEMKQQLTETEMMALRAQMNPHFVFNSLNAIDNLIQTRQHDKATTYLGRFARLLRLVLDSSKNKLVPFDRDFTATQLYLDMEKLRSSDKFQFELFADPELLNGGYSIPPLLAQPFIENAIYHGLMNKSTGDRRLSVTASLQGDFIIMNITDNGVGRARAAQLNSMNRPEHTSYGWQIAAQRLGLHNGGNGEDYIALKDLYENNEPSGTSVTLRIKINAS